MSTYPSVYDPPAFGGEYDADDELKMRRVMDRVQWFMTMHIGQWFTPAEIRKACNLSPETEVTARLRDLRKRQWGGWAVEVAKRDGCYRYRLMVRELTDAAQ